MKNNVYFHQHDLVEVDGYTGYVNCICFASRSHLHPEKTTSYFTLTLKGTEGSVRSVNICIFERLWSSVKVIEAHDALQS